MIVWGLSRAVRGVAEAFGASKNDANEWACLVAGVGSFIDPIGGALGMAHAGAKLAAIDGYETGKVVDQVMSIGAVVVGSVDVVEVVRDRASGSA